MTKRKRGLFTGAANTAKDTEVVDSGAGLNLLSSRMDNLADAQSRRQVPSNQFAVDPEDCVIWGKHNRLYDRLDERNCAELIAAFKAYGGQHTPAVVRRTQSKTGPRYEVVAGARRHWVVNYLRSSGFPEMKYLVEVKDDIEDDVAAFKEMDTENRGRSDLSPYEQGASYKRMLAELFNGVQSELARVVGLDKGTISRYLRVAEVPTQILNAYAELKDLSMNHGPKLVVLLEQSDKNRARMMEEAAQLAEEQREAKHNGKSLIAGATVFKRLVESVDRRTKTKGPVESFGPKANPHLEIRSKNRDGMNIFVPHRRGATEDQLLEHFKKALQSHHQAK